MMVSNTAKLLRPLVLACLVALPGGRMIEAQEGAETGSTPIDPSSSLSFSEHIMPLLAKFCTDCHGNEKKKADLNLETYRANPAFLQERRTWERVIEMLKNREMPPDNKPQPTEEERLRLLQFIESELDKLDCDGPVNPGRVTLRRLNRSEYNNTVQDLIGIEFKPAADFPNDEVGYGFDNIGDVLSLPPMLMEKYLAAAEQIATRAIVARPKTSPPVKRFEAEKLPSTADGGNFEDRALALNTEGEGYLDHNFPQSGQYIIRVRAFGQQAGPEPARLAFRLAGKELKVAEVTATETQPENYEVQTEIKSGQHRVAFAYINNYNAPNHPDPKLRGDRNLIVDYLEIEGPLDFEPAPLPETHTRLIPHSPPAGKEKEFAKKILRDLARRAFRRPATDLEVDRLARFVELVKSDGGTFEEGIQLALQAVLVSPHFLFRWELDPRSDEPGEIRALSDYELASRLSYFLWSSMPDEELMAMAEKGVLREPAILEGQVKRMLQDPKAGALVSNFGNQWLTIRNLEMVTPDPELFPEFDNDLRRAMRQETELFFQAIMREDRSLLEFLDADFTFLNGRLAAHYGLPGIQGEEFQRVSLSKETQRGGLITQASILTITSNPTRTSPVNRGKWILEQLMGTPPPPPPPDVGELEEDEEALGSASLRQRMEQHRNKPDCAVCHNKMDPLGFALENFDAIGGWRTLDGKFPVDASGVLPNGQTFQGPNELKNILKSQESFIRALSEKMLTFALGRGLEYYDRCTVEDICNALKGNEYKFSTLVFEIVKSKPFLMKKVERSQ